MALTRFLCTNCGFWQRRPDAPRGCPVCEDFRHVPPDDTWEFLTPAQADDRAPTRWDELEPGIWRLRCAPTVGIGPAGYFVEDGGILFDAPPWLSDAALDHLASLGGVRRASGSHPHAYGALWRAVDRFGPEVALHVRDEPWTQTFGVTRPYDDDGLELVPGARLHHTGGHFAGHAVLHLAEREILLCGDALKFALDPADERRALRVSTHKAFVRQVPLSPAEMRRYRDVFAPLAFTQTWTPFEPAANAGRDAALGLLDDLLATGPDAGWRDL